MKKAYPHKRKCITKNKREKWHRQRNMERVRERDRKEKKERGVTRERE